MSCCPNLSRKLQKSEETVFVFSVDFPIEPFQAVLFAKIRNFFNVMEFIAIFEFD